MEIQALESSRKATKHRYFQDILKNDICDWGECDSLHIWMWLFSFTLGFFFLCQAYINGGGSGRELIVGALNHSTTPVVENTISFPQRIYRTPTPPPLQQQLYLEILMYISTDRRSQRKHTFKSLLDCLCRASLMCSTHRRPDLCCHTSRNHWV